MEKKRFRIDIDWGQVAKATKETLLSIGQGNFLIRLRVDKLFPYILVLFILGCANIYIDTSLQLRVNDVDKCFTTNIIHSIF